MRDVGGIIVSHDPWESSEFSILTKDLMWL